MVQGGEHPANGVEVSAQLQALAGLLEHLGGAVARQAPQQGGEDLRGEQGEIKEREREEKEEGEGNLAVVAPSRLEVVLGGGGPPTAGVLGGGGGGGGGEQQGQEEEGNKGEKGGGTFHFAMGQQSDQSNTTN